jgi:integrase
MARQGNKLTALKVKALEKPGRYGDGLGLWLQVSENGGKSWVLRYMLHGRAVHMGLGPTHTVSLQEAREKAREARKLLLDGRDPLKARQEKVAAAKAEAAKSKTFKQIAEEFLTQSGKVQAFRNATHRAQWRDTLEQFAYPVIGNMPLATINSQVIYDQVIAPLWKRVPETASRLRGRIERIFAYATVRGFYQGDNPAAWIKDIMPAKPKPKHHEAMPISELADFMKTLRGKDLLTANALEFTVLTVARTGETIGMTWDEIDFDQKIWTVPAERMKTGVEHRVPMSDRAISILRSQPKSGDKVFPLGHTAMLNALKRMGCNYTVHGMRACFSTWAHDNTAYPGDTIEMCLAHKVANKVEASYRRGDGFEKRRRLMEEWARFLEQPSVMATVTPIRA